MSADETPATVTISLGGRLHEIDLDRLTPLTRSIAEAIATDDPLRGPRPLRLESLVTVRELIEDAESRYPNRRDRAR